MTITSAMMAAKGACDYQVQTFASACPAGLDTSNVAQVAIAQAGGVDLKWIARKFSAAGAEYAAAAKVAQDTYKTAVTGVAFPAYNAAVKIADALPAGAVPPCVTPNPVSVGKVAADEVLATAVSSAGDAVGFAKASAFVAAFSEVA